MPKSIFILISAHTAYTLRAIRFFEHSRLSCVGAVMWLHRGRSRVASSEDDLIFSPQLKGYDVSALGHLLSLHFTPYDPAPSHQLVYDCYLGFVGVLAKVDGEMAVSVFHAHIGLSCKM